MTDRDQVSEFVAQLEVAVDANERRSVTLASIEAALEASDQLVEAIERLNAAGVPTALGIDDLRSFEEELAGAVPPSIPSLVEQARALLKVVEDGIIAGDAGRLRDALERAEGLERKRPAPAPAASSSLSPDAVRARCAGCGVRVVGRRHPVSSWDALYAALVRHEVDAHDGEEVDRLESSVSAIGRHFGNGGQPVEVGRYSLTTALPLSDDSEDPSVTEAGAGEPTRRGSSKTAVARRSGKANHDRAAQWVALPIGTRFVRRSDPSIVGEIVADHGFRVNGVVYPFGGRGAPLSAAGVAISGTSENGWVTWTMVSDE